MDAKVIVNGEACLASVAEFAALSNTSNAQGYSPKQQISSQEEGKIHRLLMTAGSGLGSELGS